MCLIALARKLVPKHPTKKKEEKHPPSQKMIFLLQGLLQRRDEVVAPPNIPPVEAKPDWDHGSNKVRSCWAAHLPEGAEPDQNFHIKVSQDVVNNSGPPVNRLPIRDAHNSVKQRQAERAKPRVHRRAVGQVQDGGCLAEALDCQNRLPGVRGIMQLQAFAVSAQSRPCEVCNVAAVFEEAVSLGVAVPRVG